MIGGRSSYYLNNDLRQGAFVRADMLGYPSVSAYVSALLRADAIGLVDHAKPMRIGNLPTHVRDEMDSTILQQYRAEAAAVIPEGKKWIDDETVAEIRGMIQPTAPPKGSTPIQRMSLKSVI